MKKNFKNPILERAMIAFDCRFVKDFADLFKMSPQNLSGYIARNTFIDLIKPEVLRRGLNLHWIKTGEEIHKPVAEKQDQYNHSSSTSPTIQKDLDLIGKTEAILNSRTIYHSALRSNIEAFHHALVCEEKLEQANNRIDLLEKRLTTIEKQLSTSRITAS